MKNEFALTFYFNKTVIGFNLIAALLSLLTGHWITASLQFIVAACFVMAGLDNNQKFWVRHQEIKKVKKQNKQDSIIAMEKQLKIQQKKQKQKDLQEKFSSF